MSDLERLPCPRCAHPAAAEALLCPQCRGSLAMDVVVLDAVPDERARYRLARALAEQGPPVLPLGPLRHALAAAPAIVARGATRAAADRLTAMLLQAHAVRAVTQPSGAPAVSAPGPALGGGLEAAAPPPGTSPVVAIVAVLAVLAVGATTGVVGLGVVRSMARDEALSPSGLKHLADDVGPSRAQVFGPGLQGGAGVVVAPGLVLALVQPRDATTAIVGLAGNRQASGTIVETDADAGLVLVRMADRSAPPAPLADATTVQDGDALIVVERTARGLQATTAAVTNAAAEHDGLSLIQIEAALDESVKGSPVLDRQGRVIGLVGGNSEGAGIAWVVPINYALDWLSQPVPHDRAAWTQRVAPLAEARAAREGTFAATRSGPVLLHARHEGVDQYGAAQEIVVERFGVLVAAPAAARIAPPAIRVKVGPCELDATMAWWPDRFRGDGAGKPPAVQAFERWVAANGLRTDTIVGEASVPLDRRRCPTQGAREASLVVDGETVNTVPIDAP